MFKTRIAECKLNLKDLNLGFTLYTDDNNDWYPKNKNIRKRPFELGTGQNPDQSIFSLVQPYFSPIGKNFMCPGAKENPNWDGKTKNRSSTVDRNVPNRSDNSKIMTAYNMYFNTHDGDEGTGTHKGSWDLEEYQMKRLGETFTFFNKEAGNPRQYTSFDIVVSDLAYGSSHLGSWETRKHKSVGGHYNSTPSAQDVPVQWIGNDFRNNYAFADGSVKLYNTFLPPGISKSTKRKDFLASNKNHADNRLEIPVELIVEIRDLNIAY
jgi:prepilin-type processing-associated H-X9-DG protein